VIQEVLQSGIILIKLQVTWEQYRD
jgi:hypothetical protein